MALLHHSRIRACFLAVVLLWLTPAWSFAQMTLELTVSGSEAQSTEFSLEDLDALDQAEFTTSAQDITRHNPSRRHGNRNGCVERL